MSSARCPRKLRGAGRACGASLSFGTDRLGRVVTSCSKCSRHDRGLCRDCPNRTKGHAIWCASCKAIRKKEAWRRYDEEHRDERNAASRRHYRTSSSYRERKRSNHRAWRHRNPEKVRASKRRYVLKQTPGYIEANRRNNARPERQQQKREHALKRYYELHPVRPDPKCRDCGERIEWSPPGRPPVKCDECEFPSIVARRKSRHQAIAA